MATVQLESDYLLFIDADMEFNANDVFKLLEHDEDVVCGVYPKKHYNQRKLQYLVNSQPHLFETRDWQSLAVDFATQVAAESLPKVVAGEKLVEVDYAATGFMLIKRGVFEKIIAARPDLRYTNDDRVESGERRYP